VFASSAVMWHAALRLVGTHCSCAGLSPGCGCSGTLLRGFSALSRSYARVSWSARLTSRIQRVLITELDIPRAMLRCLSRCAIMGRLDRSAVYLSQHLESYRPLEAHSSREATRMRDAEIAATIAIPKPKTCLEATIVNRGACPVQTCPCGLETSRLQDLDRITCVAVWIAVPYTLGAVSDHLHHNILDIGCLPLQPAHALMSSGLA
jgi:hypothetical protein